jgi:hypothetical protein
MTEPQKSPAPKRKRFGNSDLSTTPRPRLAPDAWTDPAAAIEELRDWAEAHATDSINWYLQHKQLKRIGSRVTRAMSVVFATIGGIIPLASDALGLDVAIGYVFLALSAGCVAFDHFFGFSSGWMRDITTAQTLQQRLMTFHLLWARWQAEQAGVLPPAAAPAPGAFAARTPVDPSGWPAALQLIEALLVDVQQATNDETAGWVNEFKASLSRLDGLARSKEPAAEGHPPPRPE